MQSAYNLLLKTGSGCTFEEFRTFSFLCKLGFRVFRHKKYLKNNSSGPKDLTKVPVISSKKKSNKNNYMKIENIKKPKSFPKIESDWVVIPKPPLYCIPYNIQPYYDTYTFNVSFISNSVVITDVISFFNTVDLKKTPFIENESMVYDDLKTIGKYPVYEMNICKTIKSIINDFNEPPIKRLKYFCELERNDNIYHEMEFKRLCIPSEDIITPLTSSNDECHSDEINDKINSNDKTQRTLNIYEDHQTKIEDETNNLNIDEHSKLKTLIDSNPNIDFNYTAKNNDLNKITTSDTIHEDEDFGIELKLPKHIRKKLFSIKPKNVHNDDNPSKNVNCVHRAIFDVYFPNNKEAKTKLLAPDFRVIVFNDNLETFPNIYDVSICNPNDNVCTLWAIVNSSTVSFYNVNNIIIPKSTDWKMEH